MARLAQIRFVLPDFEVTPSNIRRLGHIADSIAKQVALDVYGEGVEVDVLLEDGSLLTKITVIGGLILGAYHAAASYPDFKHGIATLSSDASHFSQKFVDSFTGELGVNKNKITKITVNDATPGKINRLVNTLEELDHQASKLEKHEVGVTLQGAKRTLDSLSRDISEAEVEHLKNVLKFEHLPPPTRWPAPDIRCLI